MKVNIPGFVTCKPADSWTIEPVLGMQFGWDEHNLAGYSGRVFVCKATLSFDLPADFNPNAQFIAALEKRREELRAEFQMAVNQINDEIGKLQALTHEVAA